jgi:hypothetical protein
MVYIRFAGFAAHVFMAFERHLERFAYHSLIALLQGRFGGTQQGTVSFQYFVLFGFNVYH